MTRSYEGSPVARHLVFVLQNGAFVVQWDAEHIQDLLTGLQHAFQDKDYGHAITDYELDQLRDAGRVSNYNRSYVWLHALPEGQRFSRFQVRQETAGRTRQYYLNTTLPGHYLTHVQQRLHELGLNKQYAARDEGGLVAIMQQDGEPFNRLAEAEAAQNMLRRAAPQFLQDAAVAFMEFNTHSAPPGSSFEEINVLDFETLVASQTETLANEGRVIVGVDRDEEFLELTRQMANKLGAEFVPVTSGREALHTIEDLEPDLVLMDLVLADSHAWEILAKMKANQALVNIPVIIVSGLGSQADQVFALTVAKAHDYLVKPVSPGRLRQSIWMALKAR